MRDASCRAEITSEVAVASSAPTMSIAVTVTSWWWCTKYSWKLIRPSSVSKYVASASSVTGSSRTRTPNRSQSSVVTWVFVAPSPRR